MGLVPKMLADLFRSAASNKPLAKRVIPLAVSLCFVGWVYAQADFETLIGTLSRASFLGILLLLAAYSLGQIISTFKWRVFLEQADLKRPVSVTLSSYFMGMFVNTFGLGTVGGDLARAMLIKPGAGKRAAAIATVVADRVHGLAVIIAIGIFATLFAHPPQLGVPVELLATVLLVALISGWLLGPTILLRIFPEQHRFGELARVISSAFPRATSPFLKATAISICFHTLQIAMHGLIARELGAEIPWAYLFVVIPLVNIISSLPISIMNGVGVREAMYLLVFTPIGLPQETSIAFGAVWVGTVTVTSAVGGFIGSYFMGEAHSTAMMEASNA